MLNLQNQMLLMVVILMVSMASTFATTNLPSFVENTGEEFASNNETQDGEDSGSDEESGEEADLDEVGSEDELPPIDEEMGGEEPEGL